MRYRLLWLLIFLLFIGDIVTTIYGLQNGYVEANPSVAAEMADHGELNAMLMLLPVVPACGLESLDSGVNYKYP